MHFIIDRSIWGAWYLGSGSSRCALGFVCEQIGIPERYFAGLKCPPDVIKAQKRDKETTLLCRGLTWFQLLRAGLITPLGNTSRFAGDVMQVNDRLEGADRERELIVLFEKLGHTLEFKGTYRG